MTHENLSNNSRHNGMHHNGKPHHIPCSNNMLPIQDRYR
jgi:hypothetical protein